MRRIRSKRGQGMVEYIIIVVVIALAALTVFGLFGDRIRKMLGGVVVELGGDQSEVDSAVDTASKDVLKNLDKDGLGNTTP